MQLLVRIGCPTCGAYTEVHILGGWDIEDVRHECEPPPDLGHVERPFFEITYDPPRRVF